MQRQMNSRKKAQKTQKKRKENYEVLPGALLTEPPSRYRPANLTKQPCSQRELPCTISTPSEYFFAPFRGYFSFCLNLCAFAADGGCSRRLVQQRPD